METKNSKKVTYDVTIRAKQTYPLGAEVLNLIDKTADGDFVKSKVVGSPQKEDGKYPVYLDEVDPASMFGVIKTVSDAEDKELADEEIAKILTAGGYEIRLYSRNGNNIGGRMFVEEKTEEAIAATRSETYNFTEEENAVLQQMISDGIITQEELDFEQSLFKTYAVDKQLAYAVMSRYKYRDGVDRPHVFYFDPTQEAAVRRGMETKVSMIIRDLHYKRSGIVFKGPKSVGKDVCANTVAYMLRRPLHLIIGSRDMTTADVFGTKTTDNSATDALYSEEAERLSMAYVRYMKGDSIPEADAARFELMKARAASTNIIDEPSTYKDWIRHGGAGVFDEYDLFNANTATSITNPILDGSKAITIPGAGAVPINDDCVMIATQNSDYAGCEDQNDSVISRMPVELFTYPETVSAILKRSVRARLDENGYDKASIDDKYIDQTDKFYTACLAAIDQDLISDRVLNIRGLTRALTNVFQSGTSATKLSQQIERQVITACQSEERSRLMGILDKYVTL